MTLNIKPISVAAVLTATTAIPAVAEMKYENNSGGYVLLYGQLHPALISVDDGQDTETRVLDNDLSNSRVGLRLVQPYGSNEFQFWFESGLGLPGSASADQFGTNADGWNREDIRHVDFSLKGGYGKFSAGQGSMVADGAAEVDLSYVGTALYSFTNDENAGFFYRDTTGMLSGITVGDSSSNFDGARRGRVRYDTPSFNGFSAGFAYGQNILSSSDDDDYYDVGLFYENTFAGGVEFAAAVAYSVRDRDNNSGDRKDTIGSASVLLPSGLGFTIAGGTRDDDQAGATDPNYWYGKISYEGNWVSWGKTGVGIDYYDGSDFQSNGSDTKAWGIAVVQKVEPINTDVYLKYRNHDFDDGSSFDNNEAWVLGARWKF
ncbi:MULTISPECIES: porin [Ruegeria]|uniref:Porin n=1 Tax=Ruegeria atlantica TaxID=81569 RepID=A0ABX1W5M0_9RHOB|nr:MULTISPECIES: porin [Ruegeria]NOC82775.1 porin [Ruegeria sp. HKCCD6428]NOD29143.1 porin [Ruegeria atlantica]